MVKIRESSGGSGETYARIFGNQRMAIMLSKVQSAVIRSGLELEQMIKDAIRDEIITTLDELDAITLRSGSNPPIQIVVKPSFRDPENPNRLIQADLLLVDNSQQRFDVVEVKDGYVFDTKKADGELESLRSITAWLGQAFPYRAKYYFCAFNQENKTEIVRGFKNRFTEDHAMTGRELCEIIDIDYNQLRSRRESDQSDNRHYFLKSLLDDHELRQEIRALMDEYDI